MRKRPTPELQRHYQTDGNRGTPFTPEAQRLRRDFILWQLLGEDGQQDHGGTFTEFRKRFQMTPDHVYQQYKLLTPHERQEFLQRAAAIETAASAELFIQGLPPRQREDYVENNLMFFYHAMLAIVLEDAIKVAKSIPDIQLDQLMEKVRQKEKKVLGASFGAIESMVERRLKTSRDRKSKPATIRRNVEICDLRARDSKTWTQGKLAKKYKLTPQGIRKILSEDTKWRQLAAALSTN